ncbi:hypothetical protein ABIA39_003144 [Nocardia sp. GAS34]
MGYRSLRAVSTAEYVGLVRAYADKTRRFELDGAEAARSFLLRHGRSEREARDVWLAIALHTTPEVPHHLPPEVAAVTQRAEVLAAHPRPDFKNKILRAFNEGMADRPDTTFGTMNDDVLAHFDPAFVRRDFVDIIRHSAWPE